MAVAGYGTGGASVTGPSTVYRSLPYRGYRELAGWFEELVDAMGLSMDVLYQRFIKPAARANLLDPTYTPTEIATNDLANATTAPLAAVSRDSMLDVLAFIALGQYPLDSNLTVAQKQALVQVGWTALKRKGTRLQILNLMSKISGGVCYGWTVPPFNFSVILPDGAPNPGYGSWVQPLSTSSETSRPWILSAGRSLLGKGMSPDWSNLGIGYSQFRWGYSGWGETIFPIGSRINLLAHEHFDTWSVGLPVGWTRIGTGTITQSTSDTSINWEFTGSAAIIDLTALPMGTVGGFSQTTKVNNQYTHHCQVDYKYTNTQNVGALCCQITDANRDGNTYYWNPTTATWGTAAYSIVASPSTTRGRLSFDVVPQPGSSTGSTRGTDSITVSVFATSDGTATTQLPFTIYRAGVYEKFTLSIEQAAYGERTLWLPLVDSMGWATGSRTSGGVMLEPANAARTAYKTVTATALHHPYHPAISARGLRAHSSWTNLLKGSNDFGADWSIVNATKTSNANISPAIGDSGTAPTLTETGLGGTVQQSMAFDASSKSYVGGVWVKKLSVDGNFTDVTLRLAQTTIFDTKFIVRQADGWTLLPFRATFPAGEAGLPVFAVKWGAASSNGQIAIADAYLYDVTGKAGVLYPPVVRTAVGATASSNASTSFAVTSGANVLHPLTQRALTSVVRGSLGLTVVPTFDAGSQPALGAIFDVAQGATQNRVLLRVTGGSTLQFIRWDNSGNVWQAFVTITTNQNPPSGSMTWRRDAPITIRCVWDENSTMLTAGNGSAVGTKPGSWSALDSGLTAIGIGNDFNGSNSFDGTVTLIEVDQLGAPAV